MTPLDYVVNTVAEELRSALHQAAPKSRSATPPPNPGRGRSFHPRPEIERILCERPPKVKVAQLFVALIAQLFSDCGNFATRRQGILFVMGHQQSGKCSLSRPIEDQIP